MREQHYFVYILTNWNNRVMYVGMTNNLVRRLYEHRIRAVKGFTEKYNVSKLVYFEETADVHAAIAREKEIKKWRREKKNALVLRANPKWRDLGHDLGLQVGPNRQPDVHSPGHSDACSVGHFDTPSDSRSDSRSPSHSDQGSICHSDSHSLCHSDQREES